MISLSLIRHGPTDWTDDKRLQGRTDVPLSAAGRDMVRSWIPPDDLDHYQWVSSPLKRAAETATLLAGRPPATDPRLTEMSFGDWEGQRLGDLREDLGDEMAANEARGLDFQPPGGESPRDLLTRLIPWIADTSAQGVPTVAVCHHGVIKALYAHASGWDMTGRRPVKFRWGEVHFFQAFDDGRLEVDRLNVSMMISAEAS